MEKISVLIIVFGSIVWVIMKLLNMFRDKNAGCSCRGRVNGSCECEHG
ncbi:MAG: hypothetical protein ABH883_06740 [Candidatus Omnitrophota bacterium]